MKRSHSTVIMEQNRKKETGVIFSPPMAIAAVELRKTITRRLRGLEAINEFPENWQFEWAEPRKNKWCFTNKTTVNETTLKEGTFEQVVLKCPFGVPGDLIWMRETYSPTASPVHGPVYRADFEKKRSPSGIKKWGWEAFRGDWSGWFYGKWTPAIHMQRKHCRFVAELVEVRIERLHEITEEEAKAEGVGRAWTDGVSFWQPENQTERQVGDYATFKIGFQCIWVHLHGQESYRRNPWVWVLKFKKVKEYV